MIAKWVLCGICSNTNAASLSSHLRSFKGKKSDCDVDVSDGVAEAVWYKRHLQSCENQAIGSDTANIVQTEPFLLGDHNQWLPAFASVKVQFPWWLNLVLPFHSLRRGSSSSDENCLTSGPWTLVPGTCLSYLSPPKWAAYLLHCTTSSSGLVC